MTDAIVRWAYGYCAARGYERPVAAMNGRCLYFLVDKPDQAGRFVVPGATSDMLATVFARVRTADTYVEAAMPRNHALPLVPPAWQVRDPAFLMRWPGETRHAAWSLPTGADVHCTCDAAATTLTISIAGESVASGVVGLDEGIAVYDRVATDPAFRRRGLGALVMQHLTALAVEAGAEDHLLIATPDGRALYTRLGWEQLSEVVSAISPKSGR